MNFVEISNDNNGSFYLKFLVLVPFGAAEVSSMNYILFYGADYWSNAKVSDWQHVEVLYLFIFFDSNDEQLLTQISPSGIVSN